MEKPQIMIETSLLAQISDLYLFLLSLLIIYQKIVIIIGIINFYVLKFRLFTWLKKVIILF